MFFSTHDAGPAEGSGRTVKAEHLDSAYGAFAQSFQPDITSSYMPYDLAQMHPYGADFYTPDMLFVLDEQNYSPFVVPPPASISVASTPMSPQSQSLPFVHDNYAGYGDITGFSPSSYSPATDYSSLPTHIPLQSVAPEFSDLIAPPLSPSSPQAVSPGYLSSPQLSILSSPSPHQQLSNLPISASAPATTAEGMRTMRTTAASHAAITAGSSISPSATSAPINIVTKRSRGRQVPTLTNISTSSRGVRAAERSFVCEVKGCGKCFVRSEHLHRHYRSIHTLDRPFKCPQAGCGKAFNRFDNLRQHMNNIHTKPHSTGYRARGDKVRFFSSL